MIALRSICLNLISHMKNNHDLVRKNDPNHKKQHPSIIEILGADFSDPLSYFYQTKSQSLKDHQSFRRELNDYLYSVELFQQTSPQKV